jgi:hypothetical protein
MFWKWWRTLMHADEHNNNHPYIITVKFIIVLKVFGDKKLLLQKNSNKKL